MVTKAGLTVYTRLSMIIIKVTLPVFKNKMADK